MMKEMMEMLSKERWCAEDTPLVKTETGEQILNGVNLLRLPSRDAYSYGLQLMDILFTKEELSKSLLFKSKKSEKPGLDQERVAKLLSLVDKRYDQWDIKTFTSKANQKCRDSKI